MEAETNNKIVVRQLKVADLGAAATFSHIYQDDSCRYLASMDVYAIRLMNMVALQRDTKRKDFAAKVGIDYGQLGHYYIGERNIGPKIARKIEEAYGRPSGWLDVVHPELRPPQSPELALKAARNATAYLVEFAAEAADRGNTEAAIEVTARLPLISWVSAGLKDDANDPYAPGNAEAWIDIRARQQISSSAFCLRVRGHSMVRADGTGFPDGCIIAVEPKRRPRSGDFVVVRFNDTDEATFKQYFVDGPLKMLRPLSADPQYKMFVLGPDAQLAGVVFKKLLVEDF